MTERVHAHDSRIVLQVGAGVGRVIMPVVLRRGERPAASSEIPYKWNPDITCREITTDEIHQIVAQFRICLLYTSPSPRDQRGSRMPSSA